MGLAAAAHSAVPVPIDPDGAGGIGTISVGNLDWSVGNALATGVGASRPVGTDFTLYAQAHLSTFNNISNQVIQTPALNTTFEWTYVTAFQERITSSANGGQALQFQVNPLNTGLNLATNFFQIYRSGVNANDLAGTGFNDGTLLLTGHILQGNQFGDSGFNIAGNIVGGVFVPSTQPLDQFGANNYPGITSITGSGSSVITVQVDSFDPTVFQGLVVGSTFTLDFNTSQILAYNQTDPSSCFWNGSAFIGGAGATTPPLGSNCANTIGTVNGTSGPNIIFQTDSNNSFTAQVPEPGVLALLGISLLGLGIARTRRS
jgi:hypothetical protein